MRISSLVVASSPHPGVFPVLFRRIRAWRAAQQTQAELMRLDDRTLKDISLHRSEIASVAATGGLGRRVRTCDADGVPIWRIPLSDDWPETTAAYIDRGCRLRAKTMCAAFEGFSSLFGRTVRRLLRP